MPHHLQHSHIDQIVDYVITISRTFSVVWFSGGVMVVFDVERVQHDRRGRRLLDGQFGWPFVVRGVRGGLEQLNGSEQGRVLGRSGHSGQLQIRGAVQQ